MLKKIFLLMTTLGLVISLSACTSTEVENQDADIAGLSGDAAEMAEGEDAFGLDEDFAASDNAISDLGSNELAPDEQLPDDFGSDPFAADPFASDPFASDVAGNDPFAEPTPGSDPFGDFAETDPFADPGSGSDPFADSGSAGEDPFAMDGTDPFAEPATPSADEFAGADIGTPELDPFAEPSESDISEPIAIAEPEDTLYSGTATSYDDDYADTSFGSSDITAEKTWVPVKKIADAPFNKNGALVNAVYIARAGDTVASVSQKIYGADRSQDLYNINPHFRNRDLKSGAKVYYNSPNRPNDESRLLTYYEDIGLAPEIYITREGDNIRAVSSQLLADDNAWKEVWATNPEVESKGDVAAGIQLRYWAATDVAPTMAANTPPPAPPEPQFEDMGVPPPPPSEDLAFNDLPPPDDSEAFPDLPPAEMPQGMGDIGMNNNEFPPPPPGEDMGLPPPPPAQGLVEPPPPPPPPASSPPPAPARAMAEQPALDDEIVMFGGIALLLVAGIMFIVLRKKKARRQLDFNTSTQTQIE